MRPTQSILHHIFDNGLTLLAQPMPWLESAAVTFAVPAGCRFDSADKRGLANFVCEMVQRGCGPYDSRQFIETFEQLGVDFGSNVSTYNTNYGGAMPADRLLDSLPVFADLIQRPHLPADQLEDGRLVCIQEIKGLEDDLSQKTMNELRCRFYGAPDGFWPEGEVETVNRLDIDDIQSFHQQRYSPNESIVACAGKLDWDQLRKKIENLFSDWPSVPAAPISQSIPTHGAYHIPFDSEQTHISVGFPGVCYSDPDYFLFRGAIGVLSGGFSSRLFSEIREKRGLCYTVYATCHSLKDQGAAFAYSGTSTERAQETLDVLIQQLQSLRNGIEDHELRRLKIQIRTSLVAQQESSRARANSLAADWFHLGRARTLGEVNDIIQSLTVDQINSYLAANPPESFDVVTLGAQPLKMDGLHAAPALER